MTARPYSDESGTQPLIRSLRESLFSAERDIATLRAELDERTASKDDKRIMGAQAQALIALRAERDRLRAALEGAKDFLAAAPTDGPVKPLYDAVMRKMRAALAGNEGAGE